MIVVKMVGHGQHHHHHPICVISIVLISSKLRHCCIDFISIVFYLHIDISHYCCEHVIIIVFGQTFG